MFAFTDRYKTGISFVDEEHAKLFEIIRRTNDVIHAQYLHDKYDKIMDILDELKEYTIKHFSDEENYMESINYEGLAAQKRAHETFINKLAETSLEEIDDNQENYLDDIIAYLLNWLSNHILKMDKLIPTNLSCTSPLA
jgi:hemerythrin